MGEALREAILYKIAYWREPWNGFSDMCYFMIGYVQKYVEAKQEQTYSWGRGIQNRQKCGRCGEILDVWCDDCRRVNK